MTFAVGIRDIRPPDRCDARMEVRDRNAKMVDEEANLLAERVNLLTEKEREIKLLQEKLICPCGKSWS